MNFDISIILGESFGRVAYFKISTFIIIIKSLKIILQKTFLSFQREYEIMDHTLLLFVFDR